MSSERQRIHADFMLDELKDKAREWGDLVKENRRLKELEEEHQRINGELREENNKLNNIINELEKYCFKQLQLYGGGGTAQEYYDKLQELKDSDKK